MIAREDTDRRSLGGKGLIPLATHGDWRRSSLWHQRRPKGTAFRRISGPLVCSTMAHEERWQGKRRSRIPLRTKRRLENILRIYHAGRGV